MSVKLSSKMYFGLIVLAVVVALGAVRYISALKPTMQMSQTVEVKAMQVMKQDITTNYDFVGQVKSKNEIKVMSKVSGNIVEKMVNGGDTVYKGQPLFRIDNKQYRSAVNSARATLGKSQATLNNTQKDVERYRQLAAINGVAQQTLDAQIAQAEEDAAEVEANRANLQQAQEDEQDTLILSPVDGRIDLNDLSLGDYVTAGSTKLATLSSVDPLWVQFSMSENEYLDLVHLGNGTLPSGFKENLKLILSNGSEYPLLGHIEQIDKGITDAAGTITIKASFDNPQNILMPGMFAKIVAPGGLHQGALLIPQRAVTKLLNKTFVSVVTDDNKAESRIVTLGEKAGNLWIVKDGLTINDRIIVEGINKVKDGSALSVIMVQPDELQIPAKQ
ncbi:efflux RND transporter periplasmic adaptor subunit [Pelosinus fermentans]|uniref:Efflux transporter, RND family, MFP subunit n=1 Tax=Pelosinus fermentans JBW45 TaxID=1192197 RepID=I9DIA7_9FIRM|nr:efflux RND transporter periplasmic adaptor subunit [Pelosinus fermentans]AJQ26437.1 efflux transporter, RND family, MFP subunit [Pelosinus fermentans JBW45]